MSWIRTRLTCWNPWNSTMRGGGTSSSPWINSPDFRPIAGGGLRTKRSHGSTPRTFANLCSGRARVSFIPSLPKLADAFGLRRADQKLVGKGADFEQALDLADHTAERKLSLLFGAGFFRYQESAEPGAADVIDVFQIHHDRAAAGLHQRDQAITELLRGRTIESTVSLHDRDVIAHPFDQLHAGLLILIR